MIVRTVCHTKTSTLPARESWQPKGFLAEKSPDKVLIYLIYLATSSTLPSSLRWQPRLVVGRLGYRSAASWGAQAQALGWTARELFGLHPVPERPAANYRRLSRYDHTGLIWLLPGRAVVALTATEAAIQGATAVLVYRKQRKPLGPIGDCLSDLGPRA
jgi:hypothetical protein